MHKNAGVLLMCLLVGASGCAVTQEAKSVQKSGFLGDYSLLTEGKRSTFKQGPEDQALLVYKNPVANWNKYKKVLLDPVTVWLGKDSEMKDVSVEDRHMLAGLFWAKLEEALKKDYEIVNQPGPDVLRVQAAITEGSKSWVVLDTVTAVYPQARILAGGKSLVTGVSLFTGDASVEGKLTDTETGAILFEVADRRGGTKSIDRSMFKSWGDVDNAYRFWAEELRYRLCQWRGATGCVEPKA